MNKNTKIIVTGIENNPENAGIKLAYAVNYKTISRK